MLSAFSQMGFAIHFGLRDFTRFLSASTVDTSTVWSRSLSYRYHRTDNLHLSAKYFGLIFAKTQIPPRKAL